MQYKIGLIVGRFQPFHKGHLYLIKKALEKADKIIVGIGSSNITDENNLIDFETRKNIIKAVAYKENFEDRLINVIPLDDFFDDKKWLDNLKKQIGKFDLALGNNNWTNKILEKAGHKVIKVNYYKRGLYEGWRIRKLIRDKKIWEDRVPKYLIDFVSNYSLQTTHYNLIIVGGTFDHFHKGHKALLTKAFEVGKKVTIGIATEKLYKDKFLSETVEPFGHRKKSVAKYIKKYFKNNRLQDIVPFSEFTGGADMIKKIEAIVVSKETFQNALRINELRKKNQLKPLMIIIIEDVLAEDGELISSERIRAGEIDREGRKFKIQNSKFEINELKMPESLRSILQKPLGKVYKTTKQLLQSIKRLKCPLLIAVGDIIVDSLLKEGIDPDVKVIDHRSRREKSDLFAKLEHVKKGPILYNNPGTINLKTADVLRQMIQLRSDLNKDGPYGSWLVIDGEEDLLTLPAILFAPLGSLVLYGHWQLGIIAVTVDEKMKEKVRIIIQKFN